MARPASCRPSTPPACCAGTTRRCGSPSALGGPARSCSIARSASDERLRQLLEMPSLASTLVVGHLNRLAVRLRRQLVALGDALQAGGEHARENARYGLHAGSGEPGTRCASPVGLAALGRAARGSRPLRLLRAHEMCTGASKPGTRRLYEFTVLVGDRRDLGGRGAAAPAMKALATRRTGGTLVAGVEEGVVVAAEQRRGGCACPSPARPRAAWA